MIHSINKDQNMSDHLNDSEPTYVLIPAPRRRNHYSIIKGCEI